MEYRERDLTGKKVKMKRGKYLKSKMKFFLFLMMKFVMRLLNGELHKSGLTSPKSPKGQMFYQQNIL